MRFEPRISQRSEQQVEIFESETAAIAISDVVAKFAVRIVAMATVDQQVVVVFEEEPIHN